MKKYIGYLSLFLCCSAFTFKSKKDILQKVKVIRMSSLFSSPIASFHCEDFFDSSGHYLHYITSPNLLRILESYKQSAITNLPKDYDYYVKNQVADGKMYFYYKSGKVDSMCFSGDYLLLNNVPMVVPKGKYNDLYYMLDSL